MTTLARRSSHDSFVLLQLANRRFALRADLVSELAPPVRLHSFPHTSSLLAGVIVRRGRIVPVYDAARIFSGKSSLAHRFYLIARRHFPSGAETSAIPVDGECELITGDFRALASDADQPMYISGTVSVGEQQIAVLDLEGLAEFHACEQAAAERVEVRP